MPAPIKHTCPIYDSLKRRLEIIRLMLKDRLDMEDPTNMLLIYDIEEITRLLEILRGKTYELRKWGEESEHEMSKMKEKVMRITNPELYKD